MKFKRRNLEVTIDGQTLTDLMLDFEDMVLYQQIHGQHRFELALVAGMEDDSSLKEEDFIGKIVNVQMGAQALNGHPVPFVAIIANVKSFKEHATRKHVYLSGYSPDYLMNLNRYTRAFIDKTLKDIVTEIAGEYDSALIDIVCDPSFTEVIPYVVQYKETDYEFINRLSQQYGEWFYYDGDNFVFGKRIATNPIVLELRKNLMHVEFDLDLVPPPDHLQMYNYHEAQPFKNDAATFPPPAFAPAQGALGASDQLFGSQLKKKYHSIAPLHMQTQAGLDKYADAVAGKRANDLANMKGASDTFGPTICSVIDWTDKNMLNTESKGKFVIQQATHTINAVGEYRVNFTAAPDGNDYPPVDPTVRIPQVGTEMAKVTNNADEEKNARIKVQFQWMEADQESPWLRVATTAAGPERGIYWLPEVDDEVVIAFENLNPDRPYMLATMFKSNSYTQIPAESTDKNDIKMI
ncbi:MAG: phage baseplate assembly protein V, partial [Chitinophagales bacterium]